jgi:hypothetical protein
MKRNFFSMAGALSVLLALVFLVGGCATTTQITFSATEATQGELKYATVVANSMSGNSVLQRFHAEYPHEKYRVVACEQVNKSWLPVVAGIGGALLGVAIGIPAAKDSSDLATGMGVGFGVPALCTAIGGLLGTHFMSKYIVTYIERKPGASK